MKTMQIAAVAVVMAGAAIGSVGMAAAEPLNGPYTSTVIDGGGIVRAGVSQTWTFTSCGSDCIHYQTPGEAAGDLHLQGDSYAGTMPWADDATCAITINKNSLVYTAVCPTVTFVHQLAKAG